MTKSRETPIESPISETTRASCGAVALGGWFELGASGTLGGDGGLNARVSGSCRSTVQPTVVFISGLLPRRIVRMHLDLGWSFRLG